MRNTKHLNNDNENSIVEIQVKKRQNDENSNFQTQELKKSEILKFNNKLFQDFKK